MSGDPSRGPRLRFAPSPTGELHVGNARTAIVNWLVARGADGVLVLRIEDTDVERQVEDAEEAILEDLAWLGLDWDEGPDVGGPHGPYRQSERLAAYRDVATALLEQDRAYRCFCSPDELEVARRRAAEAGRPFRYPGTCRELSSQEVRQRLDSGEEAAVRFRVPAREVRFVDGLRGETGVGPGEVGDFVVLRADGRPTYQLACVVDDHAMEVDRVIRGADHLSNTPRQILLYDALGWEPPGWLHLPLVLGPDRSRLSKRHGATSVGELRRRGYLPEAVGNLLALLGWAPDDGEEVRTPAELVGRFELERLSPSASVFDRDKLDWLDARHQERLTPRELLRRCAPWLRERGLEAPDADAGRRWWAEAVDVARSGDERLPGIAERLERQLWPSLERRMASDDRRREVGEAREVLEAWAAASRRGELADEDGFRRAADGIRDRCGVGGRKLFHPLRIAVTGRDSGPELARLVPLIEAGRREGVRPAVKGVAERIERALELAGTAGR